MVNRPMGASTGSARWRHRGLTGAPLPSSPGHGDAGFSGQNDVGVDEVLTRAKHVGGTAPRWLTAVAPALFRLLEVVQRLPHGLLLLLGRFNGSSRRRIARIWWRLGFGGFQALQAKI
jgi:hypothetical protein